MLSDTYRDPPLYRWMARLRTSFWRRSASQKWAANEADLERLRLRVKDSHLRICDGSAAEAEWKKIASEIQQLIISGNPSSFLRWQPLQETMAVTNAKFVNTEYDFLKSHLAWEQLWSKMVVEDAVGDPVPFMRDIKTSGNLIHHAYLAARFCDFSGLDVNKLSHVFEFGGGYGSFCRLLRRLGFSGSYLIYDLEVLSALQEFFLASLGHRVGFGLAGATFPNQCIYEPVCPQLEKPSLLVALWSLSETAIASRDWVAQCADQFDYYLVGYQEHFGEVNNRNYFTEFKERLGNVDWSDVPLKQLPDHNLLMGVRR